MNVNLTCKNLFWEVEAVANDFYEDGTMNLSEINSGVNKLIEGAEACLTMISERKKLTDKQFCEMFLKFACISDWDEYDCYSVLEIVHNLKFVADGFIKTTMHANVQKTEGHGRDFSWWYEEVGVDFRILYTTDFKIDYEHFYTKEEIKQLINDKKIIIICEDTRDLFEDKKKYKKEEYQNFDCAYSEYNRYHEFFDKNGKFYPYTLKYIRNKIGKKKLLKLLKEHLKHTNNEIYDVTHKSSWNSNHFKKVAEEYSQEFKKQGYAKRLKKLNEYNENK